MPAQLVCARRVPKAPRRTTRGPASPEVSARVDARRLPSASAGQRRRHFPSRGRATQVLPGLVVTVRPWVSYRRSVSLARWAGHAPSCRDDVDDSMPTAARACSDTDGAAATPDRSAMVRRRRPRRRQHRRHRRRRRSAPPRRASIRSAPRRRARVRRSTTRAALGARAGVEVVSWPRASAGWARDGDGAGDELLERDVEAFKRHAVTRAATKKATKMPVGSLRKGRPS